MLQQALAGPTDASQTAVAQAACPVSLQTADDAEATCLVMYDGSLIGISS